MFLVDRSICVSSLYSMLSYFRLCFCGCVSVHQALLLWMQVDRSIAFLHTMFCYLGCASAVVFLYAVFS